MRTATDAHAAPSPAVLHPALALAPFGGAPGLRAMAAAHEHALARTAAVNNWIAAFVVGRLRHDREALAALAACRTPQEAMTVWSDFLERAARQYGEALSGLPRLATAPPPAPAPDTGHEAAEPDGAATLPLARSA